MISKKGLGNKKGFTLPEILVAVGLMSIVSALFAFSILDMKVSEEEFRDKNDALLFMNSLSTYTLGNQDNCSGIVTGKTLPAPGAAAVPFSITGYQGYGATGGPIQAGSVITGTPANPGLRVKSVTLQAKSGIVDSIVRSGSVDYTRRVAVVTISLERRQRKTNNQFLPLPDRVVEFPVYLNSLGVMSACQLEMTPADVCQMIGSTLNVATPGTCTPAAQCQVKGSYATSTCSPAYGGCPASILNPVTAAASCPAGSTATQTGQVSGTFNVSCGKKCSYNVTNTFVFYLCMQCT